MKINEENESILREWPTIYIEAEFHAIWVSPSGEFVDITPNDYGVNKILFLPDRDKMFSPMKNVNKLTVLPVRKLMDIMTITS